MYFTNMNLQLTILLQDIGKHERNQIKLRFEINPTMQQPNHLTPNPKTQLIKAAQPKTTQNLNPTNQQPNHKQPKNSTNKTPNQNSTQQSNQTQPNNSRTN